LRMKRLTRSKIRDITLNIILDMALRTYAQ
jgi:hypothetical protein